MCVDEILLSGLCRYTVTCLRQYSLAVREGKDVMAGSYFARYVEQSRLLELFEKNPRPEPLAVDGKQVRKLVRDLIYDCGERFKDPKSEPLVALSELEGIHQRLAAIESRLASDASGAVTCDIMALPEPARAGQGCTTTELARATPALTLFNKEQLQVDFGQDGAGSVAKSL
jgi:hypothetical protein